MARWPNFFIVGAARAGTSSLYHYLRRHPDVFMSPVKEPHYFAHVNPGPERLRYLPIRLFPREEQYLRLFEGARGHPVVGEASTGYLYDPEAPARIRERAPDARIVALLRDPVERAYSHYLLHVAGGTQHQPFYDALVEDSRRCPKGLGYSYLYVERGLYHQQVRRYLDTFGPERVRVYLYEDLAADASGVVRDVCAFLGVPFYDGRFFDPTPQYATYSPRFGLVRRLIGNRYLRALGLTLPERLSVLLRHRLLLTRGAKPTMDERARAFLHSVFAGDVALLQGLLGRDLDHWLRPAIGGGRLPPPTAGTRTAAEG